MIRMRVHGVILSVALSVPATAQWSVEQQTNKPIDPLSGVLAVDLSLRPQDGPTPGDSLSRPLRVEKSGFQAAVLSLAVPGAGEVYAESYWKAGAFIAAEVGLWVAYAIYDGKGDRQTELFKRYADQYWNVVKYGEYAQATYRPDGSYSWLRTDVPSNRPPWERVNWDELNRMERAISTTNAGRYYSHLLPPYGDQQYYELIGKYPQFNPGWADASSVPGSFHYGDPLTEMFLYYSKERGKANDFYNIASTATKLVVLNHVLSALDAAWTAARFNQRLQIEAHLTPTQRPFGIVEFVPTASVSVTF
jgi:hypothetical protein